MNIHFMKQTDTRFEISNLAAKTVGFVWKVDLLSHHKPPLQAFRQQVLHTQVQLNLNADEP